jgi:hypothetical protein
MMPLASVLPERRADGAVSNTPWLTARAVAKQKVTCPACGWFVFQQWPDGWETHAGYGCPGLKAATSPERKNEFRTSYSHLFK